MYRCHESVSFVIFVAHQYPVGNILNILVLLVFIPVEYPSEQGRHCFGRFFFFIFEVSFLNCHIADLENSGHDFSMTGLSS